MSLKDSLPRMPARRRRRELLAPWRAAIFRSRRCQPACPCQGRVLAHRACAIHKTDRGEQNNSTAIVLVCGVSEFHTVPGTTGYAPRCEFTVWI